MSDVNAYLLQWFTQPSTDPASCIPQRLELLRSARNSIEFNRVSAKIGNWTDMPIIQPVHRVVTNLQKELCNAGQRTTVGVIDILIAATSIVHREPPEIPLALAMGR